MNQRLVKYCPVALLLVLMVSCHPEGCYGPKSFCYNTKGLATSNLFGIYTLDEAHALLLASKGFTNYSGSILLRPDMTFQFSEIPCIMCSTIEGGVYSSATGKWRVAKQNAIWVLEIYDTDYQKMCCRYASFTLPILGESPPYGIELTINHDTGMWIKLKKRGNAEQNSNP
jgi:hypothetical protein